MPLTMRINKRETLLNDNTFKWQFIILKKKKKQGRIHDNPVADSWAGAALRKPLGIQKCDGGTNRHSKV